MEIPLDNFILMGDRSEYFCQMQSFEDRLRERVITKTIWTDLPQVPFATTEQMTAIIEWLQETKPKTSTIENLPFVTLTSAAEFLMINSLREFVCETCFKGTPATTAKSILWLNRFKHIVDLKYYTMYLTTAGKWFGLPYSDLKSWNENSGWKDAYKKLVKYLRRGRDSKRYREKWYVTHECDKCGLTAIVDSKNYKDNRGNYNFYALWVMCKTKNCENYYRIILRPRVEGCRCIIYQTYHIDRERNGT
jgi:hypothetical protein